MEIIMISMIETQPEHLHYHSWFQKKKPSPGIATWTFQKETHDWQLYLSNNISTLTSEHLIEYCDG